MLDLEEFVQAVQDAVVQAAHTVREHNLQLAYSAFDVIPPQSSAPDEEDEDEPSGEPPRDGRPRGLAVRGQEQSQAGEARRGGRGRGGKGGKGGGGGDEAPQGPPVLTPKLVAFQFPVDTPDGPGVHTAYVPVASLMGTQNFEITEFKLNLKVALAHSGKSSLKLGFPGETGRGQARAQSDKGEGEANPEIEMGSIEVVIKSTKPPRGYYELIRGYDRALRADIPG